MSIYNVPDDHKVTESTPDIRLSGWPLGHGANARYTTFRMWREKERSLSLSLARSPLSAQRRRTTARDSYTGMCCYKHVLPGIYYGWCLSHYEKIHHFGEDPDHIRDDHWEDISVQARKESTGLVGGVLMCSTYASSTCSYRRHGRTSSQSFKHLLLYLSMLRSLFIFYYH